MKHLLLIPLLIIAPPGAFAATRCIPDLTGMQCKPAWASEANLSEVESTCTNGSITTTVLMSAMCASDSYNTMGEIADQIHISPNPKENTYCWCRMLKPAVSKWVSIDMTTDCTISTCINRCLLNGTGTPDFRNPIMQNII